MKLVNEKLQHGRFIDTNNVLDAQYLLTDDTLDLVVVRGNGEEVVQTTEETELSHEADMVRRLYNYDPKQAELDKKCQEIVSTRLPGIVMDASGMFFGDTVNDSSGTHIDLGTHWPFVGPLACSWASSGEAVFRGQKLPHMLVKPWGGEYTLNPFTLGMKAFVHTSRHGLDRPRTAVHQKPYDRVYFANHPWATLHNVKLLSKERSARLYDQRLFTKDPSKFNDLMTLRARRRIGL